MYLADGGGRVEVFPGQGKEQPGGNCYSEVHVVSRGDGSGGVFDADEKMGELPPGTIGWENYDSVVAPVEELVGRDLDELSIS